MKETRIICDRCGRDTFIDGHWENRPSVFKLAFPRDGINGGKFEWDVCRNCRHEIYDAIVEVLNNRKEQSKCQKAVTQ